MKSPRLSLVGLACAMYGASPWVHAQNGINDNLTGSSSSYEWITFGGACLTAGDGSGPIPACVGNPYYDRWPDGTPPSKLVGGTSGQLPDLTGQGALRLTNGDTALIGSNRTLGTIGTNSNSKSGAVVGKQGFPTNSGVDITFKTVTYGGNGYDKATRVGKSNGQGADGMSFFLADAAESPSIGAIGGSLGYACSNATGSPDGVVGGYIGIGIDEFGNFNDALNTTSTGSTLPGPGITLRAAGSISYSALSKQYPTDYPSSVSSNTLRQLAVNSTCKKGTRHRYDSVARTFVDTGTPIAHNYKYVTSTSEASASTPAFKIANQQGVPEPTRNKATPITYNVKITQDGILDFTYKISDGADIPVIRGKKITDDSGPLPEKFRFGFSASTGSGSNIHEITCFKAEPVDKSESSASSNGAQGAKIQAGSQVYTAFYHSTNWWGALRAQDLVFEAGKGVSINSKANWDASCKLTGGKCPATGDAAVMAQDPSSRTMLTWNPKRGAGIPFQWASLDIAQQSAVRSRESLNYLRGDRTQEVTPTSGSFRKRDGVLGDIMSSGPTWVGPPALPYEKAWVDAINPTAVAPEPATGAQSYSEFKKSAGLRQNVVYVGANDGFVHGFRAGAFDALNVFAPSSAKPNDGVEVLAFMPSSALNTIRSSTPFLDYGSTSYAHNLFVDATPGVGDLYYNNAWHTWLVSGVGAGANPNGPINDTTSVAQGTLFALDVTDPSKFSEANAGTIVKGEWTSSTLACNVIDCGDNLGSTYGTPIIRRLHDGNWAALFGNGLNSKRGNAGLFIMHVNAATGAITFRFLDTDRGPKTDAVGTVTARNGIVQVASADLDLDHVTDYVYAGDVLGNLWRFDLTAADPDKWTVSTAPVFSTPGGEPISTGVTVSGVSGIGSRNEQGVLVAFGTGQQWPLTLSSSTQTAPGAHSLYGIWDTDLSAWNAKASAAAQYAFLTPAVAVTASDLQEQKVLDDVDGKRTLTANQVCWQGSTNCKVGPNNKLGWKLLLPGTNEQVVYNPITEFDKLIVNTLVPEAAASKLSCEAPKPNGYTMAPLLATGGADKDSFFADKNGNFVKLNGRPISGLAVGFVGSPFIVRASDGTAHLVGQKGSGGAGPAQINPNGQGNGQRLTWIKRR